MNLVKFAKKSPCNNFTDSSSLNTNVKIKSGKFRKIPCKNLLCNFYTTTGIKSSKTINLKSLKNKIMKLA